MSIDSSAGSTQKGVTGNGRLAFNSCPALWTEVGSRSVPCNCRLALNSPLTGFAISTADFCFAFISSGCPMNGALGLNSTATIFCCLTSVGDWETLQVFFFLFIFFKLGGAGT